jgi:hypothetical protein
MLVKNGSHPYAWRHLKGGSVPSIADIIKTGGWPFAPSMPLPPGVQPLDVGPKFRSLPADIQTLFTRAFTAPPAARPSAREWADALTTWETTLTQGPFASVQGAASAFASALSRLVAGAAVLQAARRVIQRLLGNGVGQPPPISNAPANTATTPHQAAWVAGGVAVAVAVSALIITTSRPATTPSPPPGPAATPAQPANSAVPRTALPNPQPKPGRFDGIPVWEDLDREVRTEREKSP